MQAMFHVELLSLILFVQPLGCGSTTTQDSSSVTTDTGTDACADIPIVSYANFGEGFLLENCQGCHASTSANRHDAPEDVSFDSVEEAWTWSTVILAVATGDEQSMPPNGGITDDDQTRLEWWFGCAAPGT